MTAYNFTKNHRRVAFERAQREADMHRADVRNHVNARIERLNAQREAIARIDRMALDRY